MQSICRRLVFVAGMGWENRHTEKLMAQSIFFGRVLSIIGINCLKSNPTPFDNQPKIPYLRPQTKTTCQMLLYRQLWKNLTQTANRLTQQLVVVAYSTVNQVITPPSKKTNKK